MPTKALRPCTWPTCGRLVKRGRCPEHESKHRRQEDQRRGSRQERGYGAAWDRLRLEILERDGYLCQIGRGRGGCTIDATEVDHRIAKADGGTDDEANLQAACHTCHARKTGQEEARRRGAARPVSRTDNPGGGSKFLKIPPRTAPGVRFTPPHFKKRPRG